MPAYQFKKVGTLIDTPAGMPGPGPYYPSLVDMRQFNAFPFDFALYFSTDHVECIGGVWLYACDGDPSNRANWMSYDEALAQGKFDHIHQKPSANPIVIDEIQGDGHTETAHACIVDSEVILTYHKNNIPPSQATILSRSSDGIHFERLHGEDDSVVLRYDTETAPGNGHTGYFRWYNNPFSGIAQRYMGYSLHGGGTDYFSALWVSNNGLDWQRQCILKPIEGQGIEHSERMIVWHEIDPNTVRKINDDEYVALACISPRAHGSEERITEIIQVYLGSDGVTLTRPAQLILSVGQDGDLDTEELGAPTLVEYEGKLVMVYCGVRDHGETNTLMVATGRFDETCTLLDRLESNESQHHILR